MVAQPGPTRPSYADEFARYLDSQSASFTYQVDGTVGGNLYLGHMPADVASGIQIRDTSAGAPSDRLPYDETSLQFIVRSETYLECSDLAYEIFDLCHGMAGVTLPGGTLVVLAYAVQLPIDLGLDDLGRYERSVNVVLEARARTTHRPL